MLSARRRFRSHDDPRLNSNQAKLRRKKQIWQETLRLECPNKDLANLPKRVPLKFKKPVTLLSEKPSTTSQSKRSHVLSKKPKLLQPLQFYLCPTAGESGKFHFHEQSLMKKRWNDRCDKSHGKQYAASEFAVEGAKAYASKESSRFLNIQKLLLENRVAVELALKKESRGEGPAPHQVMDKLLNIKPDELVYKGTEFHAFN